MIIDMHKYALRRLGMIATSPSYRRFFQPFRLAKGQWAMPFRKSARSRNMNKEQQ